MRPPDQGVAPWEQADATAAQAPTPAQPQAQQQHPQQGAAPTAHQQTVVGQPAGHWHHTAMLHQAVALQTHHGQQVQQAAAAPMPPMLPTASAAPQQLALPPTPRHLVPDRCMYCQDQVEPKLLALPDSLALTRSSYPPTTLPCLSSPVPPTHLLALVD